MTRRRILETLAAFLPAARLAAQASRYKISLAEWSLHRAIRDRWITNLDFPRVAREHFGIEGLEFVNTLWGSPTAGYIAELKKRMNDTGTKAVLIMCDSEGELGHSDKTRRAQAARNHFKWADAAAEIGCHAIRVNMYGEKQPGTPQELDAFIGYCADGFAPLCEYARERKLSVLIENHGGVSSNVEVLVKLLERARQPNLGLLPDFGNFPKETDKYDQIRRMMPHARAVSFKCYEFGLGGSHAAFDLARMMKIVTDAGYKSWVGIEYEGEKQAEFEGIAEAKRFLDNWKG